MTGLVQLRPPVKPEDFVIPDRPRLLTLNADQANRLIVIGDIHGCFDELLSLLVKVRLQERDLLVFAGDLVDRGPNSAGAVAFVRQLCESRPAAFCVMGNHEEKHIRFRRHLVKQRLDPKYRNPMRNPHPEFLAIQDEMSDEEVLWLAGLPAAVVLLKDVGFPTHIITHAGVIPGIGLHQATKGLIRNRYVTDKDGYWTTARANRDWSCPEGAVPWSTAWHGDIRVIYGHIMHDAPHVENNTYGIDTGCVFGGALTAYIEDLKTSEVRFESVAAARTYFGEEEAPQEP